MLQIKIQDKKSKKIVALVEKKKDKQYKKYVTLKKYEEDNYKGKDEEK